LFFTTVMSECFEIAIIGAGPGGLGAATRCAKLGISHILFEKGQIGNTIYDYQLRKHVMAEPSRLPLRTEVGFQAGTRESILEVWNSTVQQLKVNIKNEEVISIKKVGDIFEISTPSGLTQAKYVILAIGMQGTPRKVEVPGGDLPFISYTLADPDAFSGKNILVIGAGDAAIENAIALAENNKVSILNRTSEFSRAKDGNVALITTAIDSEKIKPFYDADLARVETGVCYITTPEGEVSQQVDQIIARIGCIMPRRFLESCGLQFANKEPTTPPTVDEHYQSSVPGLFVIGALIGYPLIKQAMNQGYEVVEFLRGSPVEPADQVLIDERLKVITGNSKENFLRIRKALPLFAELTEPQFRELISESTIHVAKAGEVIFKKNDYTDSFWSVISGGVGIEISTTASVPLGEGNFFGEMGLISGRRRSATVKATRETLLLETPRKQILKLIASVDSVRIVLDKTFLIRAFQTTIFPEASASMLSEVADRCTFKKYKKGEVLFREGDIGDALYVVRKGSVKVSRKNREGIDVIQTYIPAGNYVGEMALLSVEPTARSATVSAAVNCEVVVISKNDFQGLLSQFEALLERITRLAEERRVENIVHNQDEDTGDLLNFLFAQGVSDADNFLLIDSDLCVSCDNCESACAATHGGYSRLDRKGGKSLASIQIPVSCRHCENPYCMTDCPPDALHRNPNGEVIIRDSCIGCGNCVRNCPYGVIQLVYEKKPLTSIFDFFKKPEKGPAKAAKCDMCSTLDGGPACVRSCPTGAAMRVNPSKLLAIIQEKEVF
jgi:CRP-like cAMP-binding protein/thioredoxin reductase/Fe-S-cluster-containing hydrogenase component 2